MAYLAASDFSAAIAAFDQAIAFCADEDAAMLYYNRGTARHLLADFPGALADFDRAIQIKPDFAQAWNNRGMSHQTLGNLAAALYDFQQALALDPAYTQALNNRGMVRRSTADLSGALADFTHAIALSPRYAEAFNNRGIVHQAMGNLPQALADFDQAILLQPSYAQAYSNRGTAKHDLAEQRHPSHLRAFADHSVISPARHDLADAIADFDHALQLSPRAASASIHHNRGAARQAQGDLPGALADFDHALAIDPLHAPTLVNRGTARKAASDLPGARADLDRALELTPRPSAAPVYHNRGGIRVLQNDFTGAIDDYNQALAIDPNLIVAYISRGNARYHQRDPLAFTDHWYALRTSPTLAAREIIQMIADDLHRDSVAVFRNCEKHLRLNRQDITAYFRRGLSKLLLDPTSQDAQTDLSQILKLEPNLIEVVTLLSTTAKNSHPS
ncbi:MAG TPA: tetratricopeptide repeat protein [Phycisphaerae bacterium]|jgi:tetratricopeptide (TPR) repeat protein